MLEPLDTLPYLSENLNKSILLPIDMSKGTGWVANSVDPDQTLHSAASDQGLHSLLKSVRSNVKGK